MWKTNNSTNDSKWRKRKIALSCSKGTIYIIKRDNTKKSWWFLLLELSQFFKNRKKVYKDKDFSGIVIPSEKDKLAFNHCMKSDKELYIIYDDIESLIKKIDGSANNLQNSSKTKIGEHIPCRYLM